VIISSYYRLPYRILGAKHEKNIYNIHQKMNVKPLE